MNPYFYHIGFLYIVDLVVNMYKYYYANDNTVIVSEETSLQEIMNKAEKRTFTDFLFSSAIGVTFFLWALVGYLNDTPEKYLFLADVIIITTYTLFTLSLGVILAYRTLFNDIVKHENTSKEYIIKAPALNKIVPALEFVIVCSILLHHFCK